MEKSYKKMFWFFICILFAITAGVYGYYFPQIYIPLIDLMLTVLTLILGFYFVLTLILTVPPQIDDLDKDKRKRMLDIIKGDRATILQAQKRVFYYGYYIALFLGIAIKILSFNGSVNHLIQITICLFASIILFLILWSLSFPSLIQGINAQTKVEKSNKKERERVPYE